MSGSGPSFLLECMIELTFYKGDFRPLFKEGDKFEYKGIVYEVGEGSCKDCAIEKECNSFKTCPFISGRVPYIPKICEDEESKQIESVAEEEGVRFY